MLAGTKKVTLFPPRDSHRLHPLAFNEKGMDVDFQYFARPDGSLTEWLLPMSKPVHTAQEPPPADAFPPLDLHWLSLWQARGSSQRL